MEEKRRIEIGARIRAFRGQMRQHQAAEKLHISPRTYQTWELGESATSLENYERIAKLFGVSVTDILGDESGAPAWAAELRSELEAVRGELEELRETVAQWVVQEAVGDVDQVLAEGRSEGETGEAPKRNREAGS